MKNKERIHRNKEKSEESFDHIRKSQFASRKHEINPGMSMLGKNLERSWFSAQTI